MLSSRFGRLSSTIFDNSSRTGGFLVDFSAYSRHNGRDAWKTAGMSESAPTNQTPVTGRSILSPWLSSTQNSPSNLYLQGSSSGTDYSSSGIPLGECFTGVGVADSSCALSLLSNQPWGSRNQASGLGARVMVNAQGAPMAQSTAHHDVDVNQYLNHTWDFKSSAGASSSPLEMCPDHGLGQIAQPFNNHSPNELELSQQNKRQYISSTQHVHWSL